MTIFETALSCILLSNFIWPLNVILSISLLYILADNRMVYWQKVIIRLLYGLHVLFNIFIMPLIIGFCGDAPNASYLGLEIACYINYLWVLLLGIGIVYLERTLIKRDEE